MSKFKSHYPEWQITRSLTHILVELAESELEKQIQANP
jgi:hypothetical protein